MASPGTSHRPELGIMVTRPASAGQSNRIRVSLAHQKVFHSLSCDATMTQTCHHGPNSVTAPHFEVLSTKAKNRRAQPSTRNCCEAASFIIMQVARSRRL